LPKYLDFFFNFYSSFNKQLFIFPHISVGSLELINSSPDFTKSLSSINNIDDNILLNLSYLIDDKLADEYMVAGLGTTKFKTHLDHSSFSIIDLPELFIRKKSHSTNSQTDEGIEVYIDGKCLS
jgi:hypothetical protein